VASLVHVAALARKAGAAAAEAVQTEEWLSWEARELGAPAAALHAQLKDASLESVDLRNVGRWAEPFGASQ
jgi:hypothetical protein